NGCADTISQLVKVNASPANPVVTPGSHCGPGVVKLIASKPITGATNYWYANPTTHTVLSTADTFTTPSLTASKTYYVSASNAKTFYLGMNPPGTGALFAPTAANYLTFQATADFTLDSVTVYPNKSGLVKIN